MPSLRLFFVYMLTAVGNGFDTLADPHLKLSEYSDKELHGCYHHSHDLKLCFNLGPDFMKLSSADGSILLSLRALRDGLNLFQILDGQFVHGALSTAANDPALSDEEQLVDFSRQYAYNYTFSEGHQQILKEKLSKLREAPEMMLLELLSAALGRQKHQIKALVGFHATSRVLLNSMGMQLSPEFRARTPHLKHSGRRKRCTDMHIQPDENECLGMCGPGCSCWSWACGDCCLHVGCQQHDTCCRVGGIISARCLLPFFYDFSCDKYSGYPDCLQ